jgi:hypothetical protein
MPDVTLPNGNVINVEGNVGSPPPVPTSSNVKSASSERTYTGFTIELENLHNIVHLWVGGTMQTFQAPADPIFWLHHSQIDRLWSIWQSKTWNANKNPANHFYRYPI